MKNLKVNVNKIKDLIDLKVDNWNYPTSTNCYAYALGLDVPFSNLTDHAYKVGCFSEDALLKKNINVYNLTVEDALECDLIILGLEYEEVEPNYVIKNEKKYNYYLISLFRGINDFHFLRKNNKDNIWYHKMGYLSNPTNKDDDYSLIYNPKDAFFINYEYVKTYKLGYKKKR